MIQTQLLNYLINSNDTSLLTLNNLTDDYFSDYKNEFNFIKNHYNVYGRFPDKETFLSTFPDFSYFEVNEPTDYLLDELFKDYKTRQLALSFNKIKDMLMSNKLSDAMKIYETSFDKISSIGTVVHCTDIIDDVSRYDDYVERTEDFDKYYISTGFKELDKIVGGFDRQEELATIVARPNVGKSWWLLKIATSAVTSGLKVGLYSGEMSERKVGYRFDTLYGHMNNGEITHGNVAIQVDYKKYIDSLKNNVKGSLKVITPSDLHGFASVGKLRAFIEHEKLDILFIDQISLMEDERGGRTTPEQQANIIKDLKNLQVTIKKPIILVCQQNRTSCETGNDMTQIAGSDDIGRYSTMVLFLTRKDDTITVNLIKSRDSENLKKLTYIVDFNLGKFTYVPEDTDYSSDDEDSDGEDRYSSDDMSGEDVFK